MSSSIVPSLLLLISDENVRAEILQLYESLFLNYLPEHKLHKFYGSQPISMMPESLVHVTQKRPCDGEFLYNITAKLDGTRMLLFLHASLKFAVFIDRSMNFYRPINDYAYKNSANCLFDGEMYDERVFFVFDMIYYNGYLCDYSFETRLRTLQELIDGNRDRFTDDVLSAFIKHTQIHIVSKLYLEMKGFRTVLDTDLYTFVTNYFSNSPVIATKGLSQPLKFDGLIFTPRFTRYIIADNWKFPSNILYKWKPTVNETIDFVLQQRRTTGPSLSSSSSKRHQTSVTIGLVEGYNHKLVAFKTCIDSNRYAVIEHSKDTVIDDSHVYECSYDKTKDVFVVVRERTDKQNRPNTLRTANSVLKLLTRCIDIDSIMPMILGHCNDMKRDVFTVECTLIDRFNMQNGKRGTFQEFEVRFGYRVNETKFNTNVAYKHYNWLLQTLDTMQVSYSYNESTDMFDINGNRTTYDASGYVRCIKKHRQDIKNFNSNETFGYDFRLCVNTEEHVYGECGSVIFVRNKKRRSNNFSSNFQIDLTEVSNNNSVIYEVEIELKQYHQNVNVSELNSVVLFVLTNLFGKSEIL